MNGLFFLFPDNKIIHPWKLIDGERMIKEEEAKEWRSVGEKEELGKEGRRILAETKKRR